MRKLKAAFYIFGVIWLMCALLMLSYIAEADFGGALTSCYIKAGLFGALSFGALLIAQEIYRCIEGQGDEI